MSETVKKSSSPVLIALAWAVVSIPLGWGIYNTGLNAAKLFATPTPAAGTTAPAK